MALPDRVPEDVELRCPGGLAGIIKGGGYGELEVKCRHWACTRQGVTYHLFDLETGKIIQTYSFKEPNKGVKNG